ncbi:MAG: DNA translocase FtsK [Defluviitaleaceae bacterium]|nr:DNA translocase FtsK [Defluviitaleaceae bacterium]
MASKKGSKKKNVGTKKNNAKPPQNTIRNEITAIIIIAAAILVLVSLFMEDAGLIGRLVNSLLLGLFGIGAFLLPIFALLFGGILFAGKAHGLPKSKLIMSGVVYLLLISIAHMIGPSQLEDEISAWQYIGHIYLNGGVSNGGLFGAALSRLFITLITVPGTYILFITSSSILIMQITGRSLFGALQKGYFSAKDATDNVREKRAAKRIDIYEDEGEELEEDPDSLLFYQKHKNFEEPNYEYATRTKLPVNVELSESDRFVPERDELGSIIVPTDAIKGRRPEHRLEARPKAPTNVVISPTLEEDAFEDEIEICLPEESVTPKPMRTTPPVATPEIEPEQEEITINVKGIIEGYQPETANLNDESDISNHGDGVISHISPQIVSKADVNDIKIDLGEPTEYVFPPVELLNENTYQPSLSSRAQILENSKKLEETLQSFGVSARVVEVSKGPTVTRYELSPGAGVKVSKISGLADDLALNLAASGIRIEAPVPSKSVVGIEIPNKETQAVFLREVVDDNAFWDAPSKLSFAMGKDIAGNIVISDIAKMPHLLIAGSTGSGKSVCINTLITSLIYKASPAEVKLLMIDPKVVELSIYNGIPHLLIPVVTDPKKASGALAWGVREMDERYEKFALAKVRDLMGYNAYLSAENEPTLPQVVIIIDELADLMMTCGKEVEESICRLAQKARAAGIHLIIATQRPSVDVITGLIKANVPSRLAFAVSSGTDSRTILDMTGAEKLLGKGDMLFSPVGLSKPQRIQGCFISDKEVENIVNFIKQDDVLYDEEMIEKITALPEGLDATGDSDPLIEEAIAFIVEREKASTSMLQRRFRIGYNRAARMMEELVARGFVGPEDGAKPRKVLMTSYQHREYLERRKDS